MRHTSRSYLMKIATLLTLVLFALPSFASRTEILALIQLTHGNIYAGRVPAGYSSAEITNLQPQGQLRSFLTQTTRAKLHQWRDYVLTSGEFEGESPQELESIAANPLKYLVVDALLEIGEVYALYRDGKLIGYHVQVTDHVLGAIYQDGAWFEIFFDANFGIVKFYEHSA
jgi:hypothetical protein